MNYPFFKHLAFNLNPSRESRLLGFAKDSGSTVDDGNVERPAWLQVDASAGTTVDALIAKSRAEVEGVKELPGIMQSPTALIAILDSQEFAAYRQRIEFRMHRQEPQVYGPIAGRTHLSGRTILDYLVTHPSDAKAVYEVINDLSKDPAVLLNITQELQRRQERYLEQERILTTSYGKGRALDIDKYNLLESRLQAVLTDGTKACVTDWVRGQLPYSEITDAKLKPTKSNINRELKNVFSRQIAKDPLVEYKQKPSADPNHHRAFAWLSNLAKKGFELIKKPDEQAELQANQLETNLRSDRHIKRMSFTSRQSDVNPDAPHAPEVDFKEETLADVQGHLVVLKNLLLKKLEGQAAEVRDEICKEMEQLGIVTEFANEAKEGRAGVAHRLEQKYGVSYQGFDEAFTDTIRTVDQILDPTKQSQILPSVESLHFVTAIAVLQRDLSYKQQLYKDKTGVFARELEGARLHQAEIVGWAKGLNDGRLRDALADLDSNVSKATLTMLTSLPSEKPGDLNLQTIRKILEQLKALALGNVSGEELEEVYLHYESPRRRAQTEQLVNVLADPSYATQLQAQHEYRTSDDLPENNDLNRRGVLKRLTAVQTKFDSCEALQLTICKLLQVPAKLRRSYAEVNYHLKRAAAIDRLKEPTPKDFADCLFALNQAKNLVNLLESTHQEIASPVVERLSKSEFEARTGNAKAMAGYSDDTGKIYLNIDAIKDSTINKQALSEQQLIEDEQGHLIVHVLSAGALIAGKRIGGGLYHNLLGEYDGKLGNIVSRLITQSTEKGSLAERWGLTTYRQELFERTLQESAGNQALAEKIADRKYREFVTDELLNKCASWAEKTDQQRQLDADNALLQRVYDSVTPPDVDRELQLKAPKPSLGAARKELVKFETGDDGSQAPPAIPPPSTDEEAAQYPPDTNKAIRDIQADIDKLEVFFKSYPEHSGELELRHQEYQAMLDEINDALVNGTSTEQQVHNALEIVKEPLGANLKEVTRLRSKLQDLSDAPNVGREGWRTLFDYVDFYSINDIWGMIKDSAEDINRYWKRRVDYKKASLGEDLTRWISDKVPYAGRLKHEFHKRGKTAEIEEVNQWKEGLKDDDSFSLLDSIKDIRNADQLKAIFELLTERGRMDWNHEGVWDALNALSIYEMPKAACRRDDVLRDKWLRKLIAEIYDDKDKYNEWRQSNDSNYESGKEKFSGIADQVSNLRGGLSGALAQQLEMYVLARKNKQPIPEEVNPHLYEKILFYSIENGKMTMEEKFFYLVQGIRYRLMSRDRLAVIAGEGGKILNIFPFIDYFYGKNNSTREIEELGIRLEEPQSPYEPGLATTMFVRLEVAREEAVKERLRKGVSKQGENIDHDDIPYFIPELDYSGVDEWFANMSGSRQKLSKEALKNSYVGYSMKLKSFTALATMEDERIAKFSGADVQDLGQTIAAYIFADNILTRNGYDDPARRPYLSKSEIENHRPVYGAPGQVGANYRNQLNGFVGAVIDKYFTQADWDKINQQLGATGDGQINGSNFTGLEVGTNSSNDALRKNVHNAIGPFVQLLTSKLLADQEGFKELLKEYGNRRSAPSSYKNHKSQYFVEDGVAAFDSEKIVNMYKEQKRIAALQ